MSTETPLDPSTYTGAYTEIGLQEAKNFKLADIAGFDSDEPDTKSTPATKEAPSYEVDEVAEVNTETEDDDSPWGSDDKPAKTTDDDEDDEVQLKSDEPEYLKQKAINESWKAKRIEKELKAAKEELAKFRSAQTQVQETPKQEPIQIAPEIPQHIRAKIKDNLDHVIFSDPEMIELANKEAEIKKNVNNYETLGEYAEALTDVQTEFKSRHLAARQYMQQYNEQVKQTENANVAKIMDNFTTKVNAVKDQYPQVEKAVEYLNKNADKLHIEVRRALLLDENAGELAWHLGSSKKAMDLLIKSSEAATKNRGIPTDALMYIGDLKGRIKSKTTEVPTESTVHKPAVPKVIKSSQSNAGKDMPEDLLKWGKQARDGKAKMPWN